MELPSDEGFEASAPYKTAIDRRRTASASPHRASNSTDEGIQRRRRPKASEGGRGGESEKDETPCVFCELWENGTDGGRKKKEKKKNKKKTPAARWHERVPLTLSSGA